MKAYDVITDQIIAQLEAGTVPWRKPWTTTGQAAPKNLVSGRPYRGINILILASAGYASPYWLTLRQANDLGGRVRKGEKSTAIVFWKWNRRETVDEATGEPKVERAPILRFYRVFNIAQVDGVPVPDALAPAPVVEPIAAAEAIVAGVPNGPVIAHGATAAAYSPRLDRIIIPARDAFHSPASYYATLFHELGHATGHESRLNRAAVAGGTVPPFGSPDYSAEELVAELTSAFLCGEAGIVPATIDNAAAYIGGWLKKLREDKRAIIIAGAQAQKAADYLLDRRAAVEADDAAAVA